MNAYPRRYKSLYASAKVQSARDNDPPSFGPPQERTTSRNAPRTPGLVQRVTTGLAGLSWTRTPTMTFDTSEIPHVYALVAASPSSTDAAADGKNPPGESSTAFPANSGDAEDSPSPASAVNSTRAQKNNDPSRSPADAPGGSALTSDGQSSPGNPLTPPAEAPDASTPALAALSEANDGASEEMCELTGDSPAPAADAGTPMVTTPSATATNTNSPATDAAKEAEKAEKDAVRKQIAQLAQANKDSEAELQKLKEQKEQMAKDKERGKREEKARFDHHLQGLKQRAAAIATASWHHSPQHWHALVQIS